MARTATKAIFAADMNMNHEIIWAPWRIGYITGDEGAAGPEPTSADLLPGADAGCFLCQAAGKPAQKADDRTRLVVARSEHAVVVAAEALGQLPEDGAELGAVHERLDPLVESRDALAHVREPLDVRQVAARLDREEEPPRTTVPPSRG